MLRSDISDHIWVPWQTVLDVWDLLSIATHAYSLLWAEHEFETDTLSFKLPDWLHEHQGCWVCSCVPTGKKPFLPANLVLGLKHLGVHSQKKGWDWTTELHQMVMRECFSPLVHKCQIQFSIPTRPDDNHLQRRCLRTLTHNWVYFRVVGAGYQRPLDHWQDAQRLDSLANDWGLRGEMFPQKSSDPSYPVKTHSLWSVERFFEKTLKPIYLLLQICSLMWGMETDTPANH